MAWIVVAVLVVGCGARVTAPCAAAQLGFEPEAIVEVGSAAVVPETGRDGAVSIVAIRNRDGAWVASPLTSSPGTPGTDSVHLFSYGGATGETWNSFVFGSAAPGTARVEVAGFPDQRGGTVVDGAWVIALRDKDLGPEDLAWRFIAEDGTVRTGTGIFPPDA